MKTPFVSGRIALFGAVVLITLAIVALLGVEYGIDGKFICSTLFVLSAETLLFLYPLRASRTTMPWYWAGFIHAAPGYALWVLLVMLVGAFTAITLVWLTILYFVGAMCLIVFLWAIAVATAHAEAVTEQFQQERQVFQEFKLQILRLSSAYAARSDADETLRQKLTRFHDELRYCVTETKPELTMIHHDLQGLACELEAFLTRPELDPATREKAEAILTSMKQKLELREAINRQIKR